MTDAINILQKYDLFSDQWTPRNIAAMNDYLFKVVRIEGDFVWHSHPDTDEVFVIMDGEVRLDFRDKSVTLRSGEMYVVPKGVEHKPFAETEAKVMLIEPKGTLNTGDAGGERTAPEDAWI